MKISILMPSFNAADYVEEALASLLRELGPDDEVIVQDGASKDRTVEVVTSLRDARIKLVSEPDFGQADALSRAAVRATGAWVGWTNADDLAFPGGLATLRGIAQDTKADVIYGDHALVDAEGVRYKTFRPGSLKFEDLFWGPRRPFNGSMLIRRSLLLRSGLFDPSFNYCMDYELYLRLWRRASSVAYTPTLVGALRIHPGTKTTSTPWRFVREARMARRKHAASARQRVLAEWPTLRHAVTVASTPIRSSSVYRAIRHRESR